VHFKTINYSQSDVTSDDMHVPRRSSNYKAFKYHEGLFLSQRLMVIW